MTGPKSMVSYKTALPECSKRAETVGCRFCAGNICRECMHRLPLKRVSAAEGSLDK